MTKGRNDCSKNSDSNISLVGLVSHEKHSPANMPEALYLFVVIIAQLHFNNNLGSKSLVEKLRLHQR